MGLLVILCKLMSSSAFIHSSKKEKKEKTQEV
jgi:hypothetical protein